MKGAYVIDTSGQRDLTPDVIDADGLPRVMPASYYAGTTVIERGLLAVRHGLYCLPTVELVEWLREFLRDRKGIEIGCGNGRLAEAVGIVGTDARLQERADVRRHYEQMQQPLIRFGPNVVHLDAHDAIVGYEPDVVIGAWITHKYNPRRHSLGGNMFGPDTDWILAHCQHYVLIGNEQVHAQHPLWLRPHVLHHPEWLYSRAMNGSRDFIAVWKGRL